MKVRLPHQKGGYNDMMKAAQKMQEDMEVKPEDVVRKFEEEQEEKAIISYQELVDNVKAGKIEVIDDEESDVNFVESLEVDLTEEPIIETEIVEYKFKEEEEPFTLVLCEDGVYNVVGPMIKKLFDKTDFNNDPSIRRFAKQIRDLGVDAALREKGVQNGDTVRILDYEFEFYD